MRCGVMHSCAVYLWIVRFGECYQHAQKKIIIESLDCCKIVLYVCTIFFMILLKYTMQLKWTYTYIHTHTKQQPQFIYVSIWLCIQLIKVMIMKLFNCVPLKNRHGLYWVRCGCLVDCIFGFSLQNWIWMAKIAKIKIEYWLFLKCCFCVIQSIIVLYENLNRSFVFLVYCFVIFKMMCCNVG